MGSYWNQAAKDADFTLSDGNKVATIEGSNLGSVQGELQIGLTDLVYFEVVITGDGAGSAQVGISNADLLLTFFLGGSSGGVGFSSANGDIFEGTGGQPYGESFGSPTVVGIAVNAATKRFYASVDDVWQNGADPAAGTGGYAFGIDGPYYAAAGAIFAMSATLRIKLSEFTGTVPNGFRALAPGIIGILTAAEAPDAFAGIGRRGHVGELAAQEAGDIFGGAGRIGARGTLAAIELADTFAGLGTVPQHRPKISTGIRDLGVQADRLRPLVPDHARPELIAAIRRRNITSGTRRAQLATTRR